MDRIRDGKGSQHDLRGDRGTGGAAARRQPLRTRRSPRPGRCSTRCSGFARHIERRLESPGGRARVSTSTARWLRVEAHDRARRRGRAPRGGFHERRRADLPARRGRLPLRAGADRAAGRARRRPLHSAASATTPESAGRTAAASSAPSRSTAHHATYLHHAGARSTCAVESETPPNSTPSERMMVQLLLRRGRSLRPSCEKQRPLQAAAPSRTTWA